jgi:hypothetical protein
MFDRTSYETSNEDDELYDRTSYETSDEDDNLYDRKYLANLNEDENDECFDREEIDKRTKFIDPNTDIEKYLLSLNTVCKEKNGYFVTNICRTKNS